MSMNKTLILIIFSLIVSRSGFTQMRYGNCKTASSRDKFYITPYLGIGSAKIKNDSVKEKSFTWLAGVTFQYSFERFKIGLGARYQDYTKINRTYIKPYINFEFPIYFDEFEDYGFYFQVGPAIGMEGTPKTNGIFSDLGLFYHHILTPSSGIYGAIDYSYNQLNYKLGLATKSMNINEFKLIIGYRFWF